MLRICSLAVAGQDKFPRRGGAVGSLVWRDSDVFVPDLWVVVDELTE